MLSGLRPTFVAPELDPELHIAHCITPEALDRRARGDARRRRRDDRLADLLRRGRRRGRAGRGGALARRAAGRRRGVGRAPRRSTSDLPAPALALGADLVVSSMHKVVGSLTQSAIVHLGHGDADRRGRRRPLRDARRVDEPELAAVRRRSTPPGARRDARPRAARRDDRGRWRGCASDPRDPGARRARRAARAARPACTTTTRCGSRSTCAAPARPATSSRALLREARRREHGARGRERGRRGVRHGRGRRRRRASGCGRAARHAVGRAAGRSGTREREPFAPPPPWGELAMTPREAFLGPQDVVPGREAAGRVAAESLAAYPPGIPNVLPGERLTAETLEYVQQALDHGGSLRGASDRTLRNVRVVVERVAAPAGAVAVVGGARGHRRDRARGGGQIGAGGRSSAVAGSLSAPPPRVAGVSTAAATPPMRSALGSAPRGDAAGRSGLAPHAPALEARGSRTRQARCSRAWPCSRASPPGRTNACTSRRQSVSTGASVRVTPGNQSVVDHGHGRHAGAQWQRTRAMDQSRQRSRAAAVSARHRVAEELDWTQRGRGASLRSRRWRAGRQLGVCRRRGWRTDDPHARAERRRRRAACDALRARRHRGPARSAARGGSPSPVELDGRPLAIASLARRRRSSGPFARSSRRRPVRRANFSFDDTSGGVRELPGRAARSCGALLRSSEVDAAAVRRAAWTCSPPSIRSPSTPSARSSTCSSEPLGRGRSSSRWRRERRRSAIGARHGRAGARAHIPASTTSARRRARRAGRRGDSRARRGPSCPYRPGDAARRGPSRPRARSSRARRPANRSPAGRAGCGHAQPTRSRRSACARQCAPPPPSVNAASSGSYSSSRAPSGAR